MNAHQARDGGGLAVHGMLVVDDGSVFLYHLPFFHPPHDFQVVLEVAFTKLGDDPLAIYRNDCASTGSKLYTFVPEPFVLARLAGAVFGQPRLESFSGNLIRGHFERGGVPIVEDVVATVREVVHFHRFVRGAQPTADLEYLVFGHGGARFDVHVLGGPPDFDQVTSASIQGLDGAGSGPVQVTLPGRSNQAADRLRPVQAAPGEVLSPPGAGEALRVHLGIIDEIYFETNELAN